METIIKENQVKNSLVRLDRLGGLLSLNYTHGNLSEHYLPNPTNHTKIGIKRTFFTKNRNIYILYYVKVYYKMVKKQVSTYLTEAEDYDFEVICRFKKRSKSYILRQLILNLIKENNTQRSLSREVDGLS